MNVNPTSPSALIPAAERSRQMGETLDDLEAGFAKTFSGVPVLLRLFMRLFALLRGVAERLALGDAVLADSDVVLVDAVVAADGTVDPVVDAAELVLACARRVRAPRRGMRTLGVAQAVDVAVTAAAWPVARVRAVDARVGWNLGVVFSKFSKSDFGSAPNYAHIVSISK